MERRRRSGLDSVHSMEHAIEPRQQRWKEAGSGASSSGPYGNEDDDYDSNDAIHPSIYPPLKFTYALDHTQLACKDIRLTFAGGCKPYTLAAFWFTSGDPSNPTWVKLKEKTWDDSFQWNIIAPVNSQLLFTITDAQGSTITSEDSIEVKSNELGMARDSWCHYVYNNAPIPTPATNASHRYSWNASSGQLGIDGDSSSDSITSGTATSTFASKVTATHSIDVNATDLNDKSTTISKAIHDANQAKTVEGVLAALLGVSLIALFALALLFRRARKRLREARAQLDAHQASGAHLPGCGVGLQGVTSEKPGHTGHYSPTGMITPRAGRNGEVQNPFDDPSAVIGHGRANQRGARSPFLNVVGHPSADRGRMSVTSLVSAVPSHGARSTAADSTLSTEFYHTYKASTIPPRGPDETKNNDLGGRIRNLFGAPLSFFSSATPSPSRSMISARTGDVSSMNTDYYGDRNSVTRNQRPSISATRSEGSTETVIIPITRVSTGSDFGHSETQSSRLAPSSSVSSTRSGRGRASSSSNGADESSIHSHDVYDDSDVASFSNFSYIDTAPEEDGESTFLGRGNGHLATCTATGSEEATTVVEHPGNPSRDESPGESGTREEGINYATPDKVFSNATRSFDGR